MPRRGRRTFFFVASARSLGREGARDAGGSGSGGGGQRQAGSLGSPIAQTRQAPTVLLRSPFVGVRPGGVAQHGQRNDDDFQ
jgi:hypothetical protein